MKTFKLPSYILFVINSLYRKHTPWFRGTFAALCILQYSCNHIIYRLPDTSCIPVELETYFIFQTISIHLFTDAFYRYTLWNRRTCIVEDHKRYSLANILLYSFVIRDRQEAELSFTFHFIASLTVRV